MTVGFGVDGGLGAMAEFAMMLKPAIMAKVELIAPAQHHYFVCRVIANSCYNVTRLK